MRSDDDADYGLYVRCEFDADQPAAWAFCRSGKCFHGFRNPECGYLCGKCVVHVCLRGSGGKRRMEDSGGFMGDGGFGRYLASAVRYMEVGLSWQCGEYGE